MTDRGSHMPEAGDTFAGYYELIEIAGVGGYAKVFRATASHLDTEVAVKILEPDLNEAALDAFMQRFYREALLTSVLNHPNTVTPIDYGRTDSGLAYIVMEYLEGEAVAEVIDRGGSFTVAEARKIVIDVLESLEEAHEVGIVHGDIKASNIFLQVGNPSARSLDFGVATLIDDNQDNANQVFGTPHYIAPEAAVGNAVTVAADIYSLGITAYELVHKKLPFDAEASRDILKAHVLSPMPALGEELENDILGEFVKLSTAKSPSIRPTATEALAMLRGEETLALATPASGTQVDPSLSRQTPRGPETIRIDISKGGIHRGQVRAMRRGQTSFQLREGFASFLRNRGGAVVLKGERGVGKERLLRELVAEPSLRLSEGDLFFMSPPPGAAPGTPLDLSEILEWLPKRIRGLERAVGSLEACRAEVQANYNDPTVLGRFADLIVQVGAVRPFVWVISSFEQADAQVALFVSLLLDRLLRAESRVIIVLSVSHDEPVFHRPVSYFLRNVAHEVWPNTRVITVPPISDAQMRELVVSLEPMSTGVADMLVQYAEGNPGRMMWLMRTAKQRRLLRMEHGRLVSRLRADFGRLREESEQNQELRDRLRHVLEEEDLVVPIVALSFLGPEFRESQANEFFAGFVHVSGRDLASVTQTAVDRNVISSEVVGGETIFTFHHHPAMRSLQSQLSQAELDTFTLSAANVLDGSVDDIELGRRAAQLFARAGAHERAAFAAVRAGDLAIAKRDYVGALELLTQAYAEMQSDAAPFSTEFRLDLQIRLGRCRLETGAMGAAETILRDAVTGAVEASLDPLELKANLLLTEIGVIRGDIVQERARRTLELARASKNTEQYGQALLLVGRYSQNAGQKKQAVKLLVQAERLASQHGHGLLRANARMAIARLLSEEGKFERADQFTQEAIRYFRSNEYHGRLIEALVELGNVRLNMGKAADSLFRDAERIAELHGHGRMLADILAGRGRAMASGGELDAASLLLLRAIERYRQIDNIRGEATTLLALAETSMQKGQIEAARTYVTEAIDTHQRARDAAGYNASLNLAIEVAIKRRATKEAVARAEELVKRLSSSRRTSPKQLQAMVTLGKCYLFDKQGPRAQGVLTRALALAESSGERELAESIRAVLVRARR